MSAKQLVKKRRGGIRAHPVSAVVRHADFCTGRPYPGRPRPTNPTHPLRLSLILFRTDQAGWSRRIARLDRTHAPYSTSMRKILDEGVEQMDRTGTGTLSLFGAQMRFDLARLPASNDQELHLRSISSNCCGSCARHKSLLASGRKVRIWDEWAELKAARPGLRQQWRDWKPATGGNRTRSAISRPDQAIPPRGANRHRLEPGEIERMALAPCHCLFRLRSANGRLKTSSFTSAAPTFSRRAVQYRQLSPVDPHAARECGLEPGVSCGPAAIATLFESLDQARLQLTRDVRRLPTC